LEEALDIHASMRGGAGQAIRWASLSTAHVLAGRAPEALHAAAQALEFAGKHGERGHRAYGLHVLATASLAAGDTATASRAYREALALSQELQMRPLAARCHSFLASLAGPSADHGAPDSHLSIARRELQAMAMSVRTDFTALPPTSAG
jgi:hypothetical protein